VFNLKATRVTKRDLPNVEIKSNHREKVFEVEIAGMPLKLRSAHDDQTVKELVSLVNEKVLEAIPKVKHGSLQTAALLTALNLAEELLLLRRTALSEISRLEAKADKIITSLETARIPKSLEA